MFCVLSRVCNVFCVLCVLCALCALCACCVLCVVCCVCVCVVCCVCVLCDVRCVLCVVCCLLCVPLPCVIRAAEMRDQRGCYLGGIFADLTLTARCPKSAFGTPHAEFRDNLVGIFAQDSVLAFKKVTTVKKMSIWHPEQSIFFVETSLTSGIFGRGCVIWAVELDPQGGV